MTILDGKIVANKLKDEIKEKVSSLEIKPGLAVICIGDNPASKRLCNSFHFLYFYFKKKNV